MNTKVEQMFAFRAACAEMVGLEEPQGESNPGKSNQRGNKISYRVVALQGTQRWTRVLSLVILNMIDTAEQRAPSNRAGSRENGEAISLSWEMGVQILTLITLTLVDLRIAVSRRIRDEHDIVSWQ